MKISKKVLATAAIVGLTVVGAAGVADAAVLYQTQTPGTNRPASPHVVRVAGKVQSVTGSTIVLLAGRSRTVNANTSAGTWVLVEKNNKCTEGQLSDVNTGMAVEVAGMSTSAANSMQARVIAQGRCAAQLNGRAARGQRGAGLLALAAHSVAGSVQAIDGDTLTVATTNGKQVFVNMTANTVVFNNGFSSQSSLKIGDKVQVLGKPVRLPAGTQNPTSANRRIDAWAVHSDSAGTKMVLGRVQKVDANTVTLRTRASKTVVSIALDPNAAFKLLTSTNQTWSLTPASIADVKAGANILVEATTPQSGTMATGKAIVVLPAANTPAPQP